MRNAIVWSFSSSVSSLRFKISIVVRHFKVFLFWVFLLVHVCSGDFVLLSGRSCVWWPPLWSICASFQRFLAVSSLLSQMPWQRLICHPAQLERLPNFFEFYFLFCWYLQVFRVLWFVLSHQKHHTDFPILQVFYKQDFRICSYRDRLWPLISIACKDSELGLLVAFASFPTQCGGFSFP